MNDKKIAAESQQQQSNGRRTYRTPRLQQFGTLTEITGAAGNKSVNSDGATSGKAKTS